MKMENENKNRKECGDIEDGELNKAAGGIIHYQNDTAKTCKTSGCGKPAVRDGLCTECYNKRWITPIR